MLNNIRKKTILGGLKSKSQDDETEKLRVIANKIDADNNGKISREELRVYIEQRIK